MLFSLCVWSFGVEYGMIWSGTRSTKHYRCVSPSVSARRYLFPLPTNFLSGWCRCGTDMKKPPMGSTWRTSHWWF